MVNPIEINYAFRDYYKKLYGTTNTIIVQNMKRFLEVLLIPCTPDEYKEDLDTDITKEEISNAIDWNWNWEKEQDQMVSQLTKKLKTYY